MTHSNSALAPHDVRRLARHAATCNLNRQIPEEVLKNLDPSGWSIYTMVIPYHNRGIVGDQPHHRVRALFKMKGTDEPLEMFVDVLSQDWDQFPQAKINAQDRS